MTNDIKERQYTMNNKTVRDEIDRELSRAYFGGASDRKKIERPAPGSPPVPPKKRNLIPIYVALAVVAILSVNFLAHNRVLVKLYLKVQRRPPDAVVLKNAKTRSTGKRAVITLAGIKTKPLFSKGMPKNQYTLYDFENDDQGWEIPMWEKDKIDHVAEYAKPVEGVASKGRGSIEMYADFPGGSWSAALAEISQFLDLSKYDALSVDVYVPPYCPAGLKAKIILTVGEDWQFVEMARGIKLSPGKWTTVSASLASGSTDWRRVKVDENFRSDVRKIAVRVEAEKAKYSGPIYIDNVRVHIPEK